MSWRDTCITSYLKWPPHVPPPGSHLSCCHDSGLAHGTRSHVLGNVSYLGRVRPSLWSRAELSWAGTKWQNCIHSDVQKHRPLSSMTHLILLLHLYSHRCLGKEWGRSFNSSIIPPVGGSDFPQNESERALTYKGVLRFSGSILQMGKLKSGDGRKSLGAIQRVTAKPRPAPGLPVASQGVYIAS